MPKAFDKSKCRTNTTVTDSFTKTITVGESKSIPITFYKRVTKPNVRQTAASICKSQQLVTKKKNKRGNQCKPVNLEPRLCGNGKPMPSLAELEKLYEDSDEEILVRDGTESISQESFKLFEPSSIADSGSCSTRTDIDEAYCTNSTIDLVSPDKPLTLKKKRKKNSVTLNPPSSVEDSQTGVKRKIFELDEDSSCNERSKQLKSSKKQFETPNSIFVDDEETSNKIKDLDRVESHSDGSIDSNTTLTYDINAVSPRSYRSRTFSPIPSTSTDNETFLKNDQRLNESLMQEEHENILRESANLDKPLLLSNSQDEIEVIEIPCETIILDDESYENTEKLYFCPPQKSDSEIVEAEDYFSTFDISNTLDINTTNDCEIIDIDDVIAENKLLMEKYSKNKSNNYNAASHVYTEVAPNTYVRDFQQEDALVDTDTNSQDPMECTNQSTINSEIAEVVQNYFKDNPINISQSSALYNINDAASRAHLPSEPTYWKNLMNTLWQYTHSIVNSFSNTVNRAEVQQSNDDSVIFVSESAPQDVVALSKSPSKPKNKHQNTKKKLPSKKTAKQLSPTPNTLQQFPPTAKSPSHGVRSIGDCPICMDNLSNNSVASTICGHIFCMKCIKAAIKASGRKCPTCRKPLKGGPGYHPLFL